MEVIAVVGYGNASRRWISPPPPPFQLAIVTAAVLLMACAGMSGGCIGHGPCCLSPDFTARVRDSVYPRIVESLYRCCAEGDGGRP